MLEAVTRGPPALPQEHLVHTHPAQQQQFLPAAGTSLLNLTQQSVSGQSFPPDTRGAFSTCWKGDRSASEKEIFLEVQEEKGEQESIHNL